MDDQIASAIEMSSTKFEAGRFASGRDVLVKAFGDCADPLDKVVLSYDLGTAYWARLGDGENGRKFFRIAIQAADEVGTAGVEKEFPSLVPNAYENMMFLSLTYEEYFSWTAMLRALQPTDDVLRGMVPGIEESQEQGLPWSQALEGIAGASYDRNDPSRDRGEYARAASTYQLLLLHRKEMRLSREAWGRVTYEYGALALRVAADALNAMERSQQAPDPAEFSFVVQDAKRLVDEYFSANPSDENMQLLVTNMEGFLATSREAEIDNRIALLNEEGLEFLNARLFDAALSRLKEAEEMCRETADEAKLQTCIGNIALVAKNTGDISGALELIAEKEDICRRLGLHEGLAHGLGNKASVLELLGETNEAMSSAREAEQIFDQQGLVEAGDQIRSFIKHLESRIGAQRRVGEAGGNLTEGPRCYLCAEIGHAREMRLVQYGTPIDLSQWDRPWSPTQGCFQCAECGRLTCYTHSEKSNICACGAKNWVEKQYLQLELDNGDAPVAEAALPRAGDGGDTRPATRQEDDAGHEPVAETSPRADVDLDRDETGHSPLTVVLPAHRPAVTVISLCVALACGAGGYLLTTVSGWLWLVAVPLFLASISLLLNALVTRIVTCPYCSQSMSVRSRAGTKVCNSCNREFTLRLT